MRSSSSQDTQPLLPKTNSTDADADADTNTHTNTTPDPSETNTIHLPSGSSLSYAIYGSQLSTSPTILYLHGYPSSRLEASILHRLALRHTPPLRIIAPDRPGFGFSTPIPGRSIASYPADHLIHLINHHHHHHSNAAATAAAAPELQITRFSVLGLSGGGPYALACTLPQHREVRARVAHVGVAAGAPYWSEQPGGFKILPRWSKIGYYAAWYAPLPSRLMVGGLVAVVRWLAGTKWLQRRLDKVLEDGRERRKRTPDDEEQEDEDEDEEEEAEDEPVVNAAGSGANRTEDAVGKAVKREVDRVARKALGENDEGWSASQQRTNLIGQLLEPFRQGAAESVNELKLYTVNWGFRLSDMDWAINKTNNNNNDNNNNEHGNRVIIWHGTKDVNAPIAGARYMAQAIKGAELREYQGSHGEVVCKFEEILSELAAPLLVDDGGVGHDAEGC